MSDYIDKAQTNAKKLLVNQVMMATVRLVFDLDGITKDRAKKVWDGYRKKLRRIL